MKRIVPVVVGVTLVVVGLAACGADKGVAGYVQGSWTCTTGGDVNHVTVTSDRWTIAADDPESSGRYLDKETVTGRWSVEGGRLDVRMSSGQISGRSTAAVRTLPEEGVDVSTLEDSFPWFDGGKGQDPEERGTLAVRLTPTAATFAHTDQDGRETKTVCKKG